MEAEERKADRAARRAERLELAREAREAARAARAEAAGNDILKLCVDVGGCLTGEHGVGIEKRDLMRHQYSDADLAQQMAVRAAFDPRTHGRLE